MTWELTGIYASPVAHVRRHIWSTLDSMRINRAWVIIGDFNCILKGEEHGSGTRVSSCFIDWVEQRGLIDLGYIGSIFTLRHGSTEECRRAARLDRGLCNDGWRKLFLEAKVRHLAHKHSNHCPLLLQMEDVEKIRMGVRPFRFHTSWLTHRDFCGLVDREWRWEGCLSKSLKSFGVKLQAWNEHVFGNIF